MSNVSNVLESSRNRPIGLRKRPDLIVVRQVYRDEPFWLIKDPLEMEFYRLNEEEFTVLEMIDGVNSLDELKSKFEFRFAPQRITHRQLQTFVSDLHKKSLLAYTRGNVGPQLVEREKEKRVEKLKKNLASILSPKWRGVDPDRFLTTITPFVGWIFSWPAVAASIVFMTSALLWLLTHLDQFMHKLPGLEAILAEQNWVLLGLVVLGMKVVHELAHGISFKRFGGECHEIGVMLLVVIIPTLYCSTTDSWLLKSKWKRAAIAAAGMYVELLLAAFATFLWWFSEPGALNTICLNIMATGTVSVVLLNGNPFFKFDGYYIFADLLELPNLRERAGKQTQTYFLRYGLGIDEVAEPNSRRSTKLSLVAYKLFAFIFKLLVIVIIKFTLIDKLNAYGLGYAGLTIGVVAITALLVPPLWSLGKFFKVPGRLHRIEMKNSLWLFAPCAVLAFTFFVLPVPHHVKCSFTVEPRDGVAIYVKHDAILRDIMVEPGQAVRAGQPIARLENVDSSVELLRLETEGEELAAELMLLEETRDVSPKTTARISKLRQSIETNAASLNEYQNIVDSFNVVALRSGQLIPEWTGEKPQQGLKLVSFDRSPLGRENLGSWFTSGQKLCTIGDLKKLDAVLAVNEHDISFVEVGQSVTLMLDARPGVRFGRTIESIARKESESLPGSLARGNGGQIQIEQPTDKTSKSSGRPADEHYESRVSIPQQEIELSSGLRGQARIRVGDQTLFNRLRMLAYRNFRKKLH